MSTAVHRSKHWRYNTIFKLRGLSQWVQLYTQEYTLEIWYLSCGVSANEYSCTQEYTLRSNSVFKLLGLSQWEQLYSVHMSKHWRPNTIFKLRGLEPMSTAILRRKHWRSNSIYLTYREDAELLCVGQWVQLYTEDLTPYLSCGVSANEYSCT